MPPRPDSRLWSGDAAGEEHAWLAREAQAVRPLRPLRPVEPQPEPPKRAKRRLVIAAAVCAALGGAVVLGTVLEGGEDVRTADTAPLPAVSGGRPEATRINEIVAASSAGVVSVQVARSGSAASGTGFVIDTGGTVVTNAHVIDSAQTAQVRFDDKDRPVEAAVLGTDPSSDLAVLRVDPSEVGGNLKPLPLANSDEVRVGDLAVAIGYPLGLDRTATSGIISGTGREIQAPNGFRIDEVIQTDAPINPGNSGGPLLDARGRVIGVNSQIATAGSQGNVGIGFAVPSNTVREVVPKLKAGQTIERPYLGVSTSPSPEGRGAVVREVRPGGPAAAAGLRAATSPTGTDGDVILSIAGEAVGDPDDVAEVIDRHQPGDRVELVVRRDGREVKLSVELARRPNTP